MHGHLVIADISGYTRFLTDSELEHANGILEELINAVLSAVDAPLTLSGLEGDAVFLYGVLPDGTDGQDVLASVEQLYISFKSAMESMVLNTTCQCNACANIKGLGLKVVMHCGEFAVSQLGGRETLTGPDVILVHRLLKNSVIETTGIDDYLLVTQACVDDLGIESVVAGWVTHSEEYEHVGQVDGYVNDLQHVWEFARGQREVKVLEADAWVKLQAHSTAPPGVVWEHLLDSSKRTRWMGVNSADLKSDTDILVAPGSAYHCAHGPHNDISIIAIVDLRPNDYMTNTVTVEEGLGFRWTDYVIPSGQGTKIVEYGYTYDPRTGERLPDEAVEASKDQLIAANQSGLERLAALAAEEAGEA